MTYASIEARQRAQRQRYEYLKSTNPFHHKCLYVGIKSRREKLPFDLDKDYLESIWTGHCAVSGIPIHLYNHRNEDNHAELDRTDPTKGYVKGNVAWLSRKFNRMKSDSSLSDIRLILSYLEKLYGA